MRAVQMRLLHKLQLKAQANGLSVLTNAKTLKWVKKEPAVSTVENQTMLMPRVG
jgi:hypothetical protein